MKNINTSHTILLESQPLKLLINKSQNKRKQYKPIRKSLKNNKINVFKMFNKHKTKPKLIEFRNNQKI